MLVKDKLYQNINLVSAIIFFLFGLGTYSTFTGTQNCWNCGGQEVLDGCQYTSSLQCGWGDCEHSVIGSWGECEVFGEYGVCGDPDDNDCVLENQLIQK